MPRFFIARRQIVDGVITIEGEDAFHIARAQRMAVGDTVTLCDEDGTAYQCTLLQIRDHEVKAKIEASEVGDTEPPALIHLFCAWPKGDKAETIVQKAVELGVASVTFFSSERCIKHPKEDKLPRQIERLSRIAQEAAKQCGRSILPVVHPPLAFDAAVKKAACMALPLFCYEGESAVSIRHAIEGKTPDSVAILVGAEGGFSPKEAELAVKQGCVSVHLGKRILRCETAPLVALSALLCFFEL
ncbi:MAG: 16S rRNA (uracil(1498)-N(3))-methyltransferase [Clostridia bacterium]|nr:16S rRNA (uracil(1498)-N(3))-methyltransferase [Clostridia bacterium]